MLVLHGMSNSNSKSWHQHCLEFLLCCGPCMLLLDDIAVSLISVFWEGRDLFVSPYFPFHSSATNPCATDSLAVLRQAGGLICGPRPTKEFVPKSGWCETQVRILQFIMISKQQAWQSPKTLVTGLFFFPFSLSLFFFFPLGKKVCHWVHLFIKTKIWTHAIGVIGYVNSAG